MLLVKSLDIFNNHLKNIKNAAEFSLYDAGKLVHLFITLQLAYCNVLLAVCQAVSMNSTVKFKQIQKRSGCTFVEFIIAFNLPTN